VEGEITGRVSTNLGLGLSTSVGCAGASPSFIWNDGLPSESLVGFVAAAIQLRDGGNGISGDDSLIYVVNGVLFVVLLKDARLQPLV
jgi:hypothetical protein